MTDEKDKCIIKEKIREVYHTKKINKYVSILSVLTLTLFLTACGDSGSGTNGSSAAGANVSDKNGAASVTSTGEDTVVNESNAADTDNTGDAAANYVTFEDLTRTQYCATLACDWKLEADAPTLVEFVGNGFYTDNYVYASILVGCAEEIAPGAVVEDIFPSFYNSDAFINTFKSFSRATYAEFTPATTEAVTINGFDAIKFTGVQEADDYGTPRTYDVYGYCAVINDLPVIVVGVTEQGKDQDTEELRAEQIHYVDEMIQTARVTPW